MNTLKMGLKALAILALVVACAFSQTTTTTTTLSAAVTGALTNNVPQTSFNVASATGILGLGSLGQPQTLLFVDSELMAVTAVSGTYVTVERGFSATVVAPHNSGATVYVGPQAVFQPFILPGQCTAASQPFLPVVVYSGALSGVWDCPLTGAYANQWTLKFLPGAEGTAPNTYGYVIPPNNCVAAVTGTVGTGNGTLIVDGSVPAMKASSTAAGASNATFTCLVNLPSGTTIADVHVIYSVQTTTATSEVSPTFKSFTAPAPSTSETASSATLVAAGGTLVMTPPIASANLTAVSAGQYYDQKIAFATPITFTTDRQEFVLTFQINQSASAAQIVTVAGLIAH